MLKDIVKDVVAVNYYQTLFLGLNQGAFPVCLTRIPCQGALPGCLARMPCQGNSPGYLARVF
jgi:hypothetical protein